MINVTVVFHD